MTNKKLGIKTIFVMLFTCYARSFGQTTSFSYTATPGSWVGDGVTSFFESTGTGWSFNASISADDTYVNLTATRTAAALQTGPANFELQLKAPAGQTLISGDYNNATRYPFEDLNVPGFWLSGNGRGDNVDTGYFDIINSNYGAGGTVNSIAIQFQQFDEGNSAQWVSGTWLYNSSVPEPCAPSAFLAAAIGLIFRRNRSTPSGRPLR